MNFRYVKILKCIYPNIDKIFENALIQLRLCGYNNANLETHSYYEKEGIQYVYCIKLNDGFNPLLSIHFDKSNKQKYMYVYNGSGKINIQNEQQIQDILNEIILKF